MIENWHKGEQLCHKIELIVHILYIWKLKCHEIINMKTCGKNIDCNPPIYFWHGTPLEHDKVIVTQTMTIRTQSKWKISDMGGQRKPSSRHKSIWLILSAIDSFSPMQRSLLSEVGMEVSQKIVLLIYLTHAFIYTPFHLNVHVINLLKNYVSYLLQWVTIHMLVQVYLQVKFPPQWIKQTTTSSSGRRRLGERVRSALWKKKGDIPTLMVGKTWSRQGRMGSHSCQFKQKYWCCFYLLIPLRFYYPHFRLFW